MDYASSEGEFHEQEQLMEEEDGLDEDWKEEDAA
jgi:hypothetical protein